MILKKLDTTFIRSKLLIKAFGNKLLNKRKPLIVFIGLTNKCNLNCIYCFGDYYKRKSKDLSTGQWTKIIDELIKSGTRYIILQGGEPLIRKDLGHLIGHIKRQKIMCSLVTNGTLIKERIDHVKELKYLDYVCISLDGDEKSNDLNRGCGSYKKILEGVKLMKKINVPIRVNATLTKNNANQVEYLLRLSRELGFMLNVCFLYSSVFGKSTKDLTLNDSEVVNVLKTLIKGKKEGYPVLYSNSVLEYALRWPVSYQKTYLAEKEEMPEGFKPIKCCWGDFVGVLDGDGMLYPCIPINNKFSPLNVLEVGFEKAWDNLKNRNCETCYHLPNNEYSQFFSLGASALFNLVKGNLRDVLGIY